jgi:hypothetical protein
MQQLDLEQRMKLGAVVAGQKRRLLVTIPCWTAGIMRLLETALREALMRSRHRPATARQRLLQMITGDCVARARRKSGASIQRSASIVAIPAEPIGSIPSRGRCSKRREDFDPDACRKQSCFCSMVLAFKMTLRDLKLPAQRSSWMANKRRKTSPLISFTA